MPKITEEMLIKTGNSFDTAARNAGLNLSQRRFCKTNSDRNIRLLAPAGSGKTTSLLWRCRYILNECRAKGKPDPYFLIVTFTRTAKLELESRLSNNSDFADIHVLIRTLNSWGWEQMRSRTGRELVTTSFKRKNLITHDLLPLCRKYDRIHNLIRQPRGQAMNAPLLINLIDELKTLGFVHNMKKNEFRTHIKYLKEIGLYPQYQASLNLIFRQEKIDLSDKKAVADSEWELFSFWKVAVVQLEENNRFTLEDQKYWPRINLEEKISQGKHAPVNTCYTHLMIDEFQDINPLDLSLVKAIASYHDQGKGVPITVAGDDDQAIFGWRGTTPKFILDPEKYFARTFITCVLDTNYRSPSAIVEASARLIRYNHDRVEKDTKSAARGRAYLKLISKKRPGYSIDAVLKILHELTESKGCEKVALIARRQASLFPFQVLLSAEGTPFYVDADLDIFDGEAMTFFQEILKIIYRAKSDNADDPVEDVLKLFDKIDRFQLQNKEKQEITMYLQQKNPESLEDALALLREYPRPIKKHDPDFFCDSAGLLLRSQTVAEFMTVILEYYHGFDKDFLKSEQDVHYKNPQFIRLRELAKKYNNDFKRFYKDIERARRSIEYSRTQITDESGKGFLTIQKTKIHLLTATRAKGKEFDAVIILDCDDTEWPAPLSTDIEEERRLFYVAMTRARQYLYFIVSENTCTRFLPEAGIR